MIPIIVEVELRLEFFVAGAERLFVHAVIIAWKDNLEKKPACQGVLYRIYPNSILLQKRLQISDKSCKVIVSLFVRNFRFEGQSNT